jgi:hypothetical protein
MLLLYMIMVLLGCGVLYQLSPALDTTSWRSLCKYLIYHLANFKLSWPYWSHWEQDFVNASYGEDDTMRCKYSSYTVLLHTINVIL